MSLAAAPDSVDNISYMLSAAQRGFESHNYPGVHTCFMELDGYFEGGLSLKAHKYHRVAAIRNKGLSPLQEAQKGIGKVVNNVGGRLWQLLRHKLRKVPSIFDLEKKLWEDPLSILLNRELYRVAKNERQNELAVFALETICWGHPYDTEAMLSLAREYEYQKRYEDAQMLARRIKDRDPGNTESLAILTRAGAMTALAGTTGGELQELDKQRSLFLDLVSRIDLDDEQILQCVAYLESHSGHKDIFLDCDKLLAFPLTVPIRERVELVRASVARGD